MMKLKPKVGELWFLNEEFYLVLSKKGLGCCLLQLSNGALCRNYMLRYFNLDNVDWRKIA